MKLRITLLVLVVLVLLVAPFSGFAEPLESTVPAVCAANGSSLASVLNPAAAEPLLKFVMPPKCGTCGTDPSCYGVAVGSACGLLGGHDEHPPGQGQIYAYCQSVSSCGTDNLCVCKELD